MSNYYAALPRTFSNDRAERRTSLSQPRAAIERTLEKARRSFEASYFLSSENVFERIQQRLEDLSRIPTNWNSYGSPSPDETALRRAKPILQALRSKLLQPDKLLPSAEGGVAFTFVSETNSRAVIESLNSGERFLLLYDLSGNSRTIDWSDVDPEHALSLIDQLRNHLRSEDLAVAR
jgi:hypothetical protein